MNSEVDAGFDDDASGSVMEDTVPMLDVISDAHEFPVDVGRDRGEYSAWVVVAGLLVLLLACGFGLTMWVHRAYPLSDKPELAADLQAAVDGLKSVQVDGQDALSLVLGLQGPVPAWNRDSVYLEPTAVEVTGLRDALSGVSNTVNEAQAVLDSSRTVIGGVVWPGDHRQVLSIGDLLGLFERIRESTSAIKDGASIARGGWMRAVSAEVASNVIAGRDKLSAALETGQKVLDASAGKTSDRTTRAALRDVLAVAKSIVTTGDVVESDPPMIVDIQAWHDLDDQINQVLADLKAAQLKVTTG